jgi:hypothetical protein
VKSNEILKLGTLKSAFCLVNQPQCLGLNSSVEPFKSMSKFILTPLKIKLEKITFMNSVHTTKKAQNFFIKDQLVNAA